MLARGDDLMEVEKMGRKWGKQGNMDEKSSEICKKISVESPEPLLHTHICIKYIYIYTCMNMSLYIEGTRMLFAFLLGKKGRKAGRLLFVIESIV